MTGTAAVRLARASGTLADLEALDFEATVEPDEVRAVLTELPAPLTLAGGEGERHAPRRAARPGRGGLARCARHRVGPCGGLRVPGRPPARPHARRWRGRARSLDWLRKRWSVDPAALPRPPVALSAGRLHWSAAESSEHTAQGTLRLAGDARAEIDLTWGPETFHVRRFALKDADSDAIGSVRWGPSRASFAFAGRVDDRSIVRVMARRPDALTRLHGNLRAQIDLAEPRHSTATGTLTGEGLDLEHWGLPVSIERVRVDASGDALTIRDGIVKVAGQRVSVGGGIAVRPETFAVNLRVTADRIDAGQLLQALPRRGSPPAVEAQCLGRPGGGAGDVRREVDRRGRARRRVDHRHGAPRAQAGRRRAHPGQPLRGLRPAHRHAHAGRGDGVRTDRGARRAARHGRALRPPGPRSGRDGAARHPTRSTPPVARSGSSPSG